jgi:predicted RNA-binding Zn-ribbon protein involved in translation (DUF1610 family)
MIFTMRKGEPAKCTNCGAVLPVDSARDAWVCGYCGTPFVVEKAIQQFNITNNISAGVINVLGGETADVLYNRALEWLKLNDEAKALQALTEMTEKFPGDVRGWSQLARLTTLTHYLDNAIQLGDDTILREWETKAIDICNRFRSDPYANRGLPIGNYVRFPCAKELLEEGCENARFFNESIAPFRKLIGYRLNRDSDRLEALSKALENIIGGFVYLPLRFSRATFILGNLFRLEHIDEGTPSIWDQQSKAPLSKPILQHAVSELRRRQANKLCPCCGRGMHFKECSRCRARWDSGKR